MERPLRRQCSITKTGPPRVGPSRGFGNSPAKSEAVLVTIIKTVPERRFEKQLPFAGNGWKFREEAPFFFPDQTQRGQLSHSPPLSLPEVPTGKLSRICQPQPPRRALTDANSCDIGNDIHHGSAGGCWLEWFVRLDS